MCKNNRTNGIMLCWAAEFPNLLECDVFGVDTQARNAGVVLRRLFTKGPMSIRRNCSRFWRCKGSLLIKGKHCAQEVEIIECLNYLCNWLCKHCSSNLVARVQNLSCSKRKCFWQVLGYTSDRAEKVAPRR